VNGDIPCPINPFPTHRVYDEGKMESIATMIPIEISKSHGIVEKFFVGADCSPEEIPTYIELFKSFHDVFSWSYKEYLGIDPQIIEHEIMTYPDAKSF
jgi:hypothetical protein